MLLEPFGDERTVFIQYETPLSPLLTVSSIYARGTLSRNPCPVLDLIKAQSQDVPKIEYRLPYRLLHGSSFAICSLPPSKVFCSLQELRISVPPWHDGASGQGGTDIRSSCKLQKTLL